MESTIPTLITSALITDLTARMIKFAGKPLVKAVNNSPPLAAALRRSIKAGLVMFVAALEVEDETQRNHLDTILQEFFKADAVADELAELLVGEIPDKQKMSELFNKAGFVEQELPGLNFEVGMQAFQQSFTAAALQEQDLEKHIELSNTIKQTQLQGGILETLQQIATKIDNLNENMLSSGGSTNSSAKDLKDTVALIALSDEIKEHFAGTVEKINRQDLTIDGDVSDSIAQVGSGNVVNQNIQIINPSSAVSKEGEVLQKNRNAYLRALNRHCENLPLDQLGGDSNDAMRLDDVYIALDTTHRVEEAEREAESGDMLLAEKSVGGNKRPVKVLEAASRNSRLMLLGDPGSGKSTFVRKLASWMANASLGSTEMPPGFSKILTPVIVVLRELVPNIQGVDFDKPSTDELRSLLVRKVEDLLRRNLEGMRCAAFFEPLQDLLRDGQCMLILDGLDEVPLNLRKPIRQCVDALQQVYHQLDRIIVTCRINSYSESDFPHYRAFTIAKLDEPKIRKFVNDWYHTHVRNGRLSRAEADTKIEKLTASALGMQALASNPMLLTTMANIHIKNTELPRERVKLYNLAVDILLTNWHLAKVDETEIPVSPALLDFLKNNSKLRSMMQRLGYEAHRIGKEKRSSDLPRETTIAILEKKIYLGSAGLAEEFLDYADQRSGFLVGRGGKDDDEHPAVYGFPHRTFQEYLAGCHIMLHEDKDPLELLQTHSAEGDYWQEAVFMGIEDLRHNRLNLREAKRLAYALSPGSFNNTWKGQRLLLWSGHFAETLGSAVIESDINPHGGIKYLKRLRRHLLKVMHGTMPSIERARAGRKLAAIGDLRDNVITLTGMEFCNIPAGPFWQGKAKNDSEAYLDEKPAGWNRSLNYPFLMARFPVTNAQYALFTQGGGYADPAFWPEAIELGEWRDGSYRGKDWDSGKKEWVTAKTWRNTPISYASPFHLPNHPVVGVSWHEALAYCRWLTGKAHSEGWIPQDWQIRLPTEPEWEKTARGGKQIPAPDDIQIIELNKFTAGERQMSLIENPLPLRLYPWGDTIDENKCNYLNTNIKATSAAGCFPGGASPYGCEEMSGSIWEWCATKWRGNYETGEDDDPAGEAARVVRGGSYANAHGDVRCSCRDGDNPRLAFGSLGFRLLLSPTNR